MLFHLSGHHPDGLASRLMHSLGHTLHQSHVAPTEYQGMTMLANPCTQLASGREKITVYHLVGRAENTYFHLKWITIWLNEREIIHKGMTTFSFLQTFPINGLRIILITKPILKQIDRIHFINKSKHTGGGNVK